MEIVYPFIGLFVGFIVGLSGMGGGALMTPLLILVCGVQPTIAIGTDLTYAAVTKTFGTFQYLRQGNVSSKVAIPMLITSLPSSILGANMTYLLKTGYKVLNAEAVVEKFLGGVLITVAVVMLLLPAISNFQKGDCSYIRLPGHTFVKSLILGAMVGFLVGFTSVGSGVLVFASLVLFSSLTIRKIIGTDVFHGALLTATAALFHWKIGNVDFGLVFYLLIGSLPGIYLGIRSNSWIPENILRPILAGLILILGIKIMLN